MIEKQPVKIVIICGPTASGKSDLAIRLAGQLDAEIVNADSMQIYRGMDIGTAKPSPAEQKAIRHHLIDLVSPSELFSAADFVEAADAAIKDITARGKRVIVAGGTGLYIRALLFGLVDSPSGAGDIRRELHDKAERLGNEAMLEELRLVDPELAEQIHPNNLVRIIRGLEVFQLTGIPLSTYQHQHGFSKDRYQSLQIGIRTERQRLYNRIEERVDKMISNGLPGEVQKLLAEGYAPELKSMRSIGYKEIIAFLNGACTLEEATTLIKRDTRRYAKRQLTWFNADNRIIWLEYPEKFDTIPSRVSDFFNQ